MTLISHLHPHHEPLPTEYQTTPEGHREAEEYHKSSPAATIPSSQLALTDCLPLPNSSLKIPRLGFGIYQSPTDVCIKSCLIALEAGYRHIDSAQYYQNEREMGMAARQSGIRRSELFLTTKILTAGGSPEKTYKKCLDSVKKVCGDDAEGYVDLFLIHTASGGSAARKEMWQALEKLESEGRAKAIGVSNFGVGHIEEMKEYARIWPPHVNQIEVRLPHTQIYSNPLTSSPSFTHGANREQWSNTVTSTRLLSKRTALLYATRKLMTRLSWALPKSIRLLLHRSSSAMVYKRTGFPCRRATLLAVYRQTQMCMGSRSVMPTWMY